MSDFTKLELKIINHALYLLDTCSLGRYEEVKSIINKSNFMIDNYCEHKNDKAISDIDYLMVCSVCNEILGFI